MSTKIHELTTDELRDLIAETVTQTMHDVLEDRQALNGPEYLQSVAEARADYQAGRITSPEDIPNV
jgi:hypothetical protein